MCIRDRAKTGFLGGLGMPVMFSWIVGGFFAGGLAYVVGKIALGLRADYLAIATLLIAEIVVSVIKHEDWLARGVKNVIGLKRPVPYEVDLQNSQWFINLVAYLNSSKLNNIRPVHLLGIGDPLDAKTDDALAQHLKDKALLADHACPKYLEISNIDIKHHTVSADEVNQASQDTWGASQYTDPNHEFYRPLDWSDVDADYRKFKKDCSREVNYLSKEFEMKKAATAFSRESIAKTGVLDTGKLHTYKFNDDIFKKVTVRPDGKNHGMIFLLDWSGSMADIIHDTYKQLLSLLSLIHI